MKKNLKKNVLRTLAIIISFGGPLFALAATEYKPLTTIPFIEGGDLSLNSVLNALFTLLIAVSAMLGVLFIAIAGFRYLISPASSEAKVDVKHEIYNALLGLALILSSIILLNVVNPGITTLKLLN